VIGVGSYPHAKAGKGVQQNLRGVPDLPSAADSAKRMCDWLLENQDRLAAPLATLDALISDPVSPKDRYQWSQGPADPATEANVATRGLDWYERVIAEPGDVAFFYCCGHGASHLQQPVVFLEELNKGAVNVWSHINLSELALALRKEPSVASAFLFSDACGEFVTEFELGKTQDCRFFHAPKLFTASRNHVSLLCAAAEAQLAYEGAETAGSNLMFGRFTLACLKGLGGSSARLTHKGWGVCGRDLLSDLKSLRRVFFGHWGVSEPFEPYQPVTQTDPIPIVYPEGFELPLIVTTEPPDRMPHYDFVISQRNDPTPPWLKNRAAGDPGAWCTTVPPSRNALFAIAVKDGNHYPQMFQPKEPLFDHWVSVP
jgi:hypothetical protein